jgi:hypothetical protein
MAAQAGGVAVIDQQFIRTVRNVHADLARIAAETTPDHVPDSFELSTLARRIEAGLEMLDKGITE